MVARPDTSERDTPGLLGADDPPAFEYINPDGHTLVQLVCDHASRAVPKALGALGLSAAEFNRHIAYDIGAAEVTRIVSGALDAPAVLAGYSRLVIDVNRPPGDPESIPQVSDGTTIAGNAGLREDDQAARVAALFDPYHDAIGHSIAHLWRRGRPPALFSIHSFCPDFGADARPWDVGVLWNRDPRIAEPLIARLGAMGFNVGDNLPYSGLDLAYTIDRHGGAAGIANCVVEINQIQVMDEDGIAKWAGVLKEALRDIVARPGLFRVEHF